MKRTPIKRKKPRKKSTKKAPRAKLIDEIDDVVKLLCKERAEWTCEWCGRDFSDERSQLQWSHFKRRSRGQRVRWLGINCAAHCAGCHLHKWHGDEHAASLWLIRHADKHWQGVTTIELLEELSAVTAKYTMPDLRDMLAHYKAEYRNMMEQRQQGAEGRIEWEAWE